MKNEAAIIEQLHDLHGDLLFLRTLCIFQTKALCTLSADASEPFQSLSRQVELNLRQSVALPADWPMLLDADQIVQNALRSHAEWHQGASSVLGFADSPSTPPA